MKIVIESTRELHRACGVTFKDPPMVRITVKVDGQEELGLAHHLSVEEMRSDFDIQWEYLGNKIKAKHEEKRKEKLK